MASGKPIDQFVRELLSATGSTYKNPPTNFYRANRDAVTRAETTARLFLGTRLQCAKCHNHPFDHWTQDDYYDWAATFAGIDYKIVENKRPDKLDKHEFVGEQIVILKEDESVKNARTRRDATPRFLGTSDSDPGPPHTTKARLSELGRWITDPANERFVQSQVNLIWYHILGRGLVEPIDDFRLTNPPINPQLLDSLAKEMVACEFDLRRMIHTMMNSRTYQSATASDATHPDSENFSRVVVKRLTAEQLLDAQSQVLDATVRFVGYDQPMRAGQIPGVRRVRPRDEAPEEGDRFLKTFGKPERLLACECERSNETNLAQVFAFVSGEAINRWLNKKGNRLEQLILSRMNDKQIVAELFWTALCRPPSDEESESFVRYVEQANVRLYALQDVAWAIVNSKEFIFRN